MEVISATVTSTYTFENVFIYYSFYIIFSTVRMFPKWWGNKKIRKGKYRHGTACKCFYASAIFTGGGGGGGGGGAYSITAVGMYVRPVLPSVLYITLLVSVRYLLKGLVYWIEILFTGI